MSWAAPGTAADRRADAGPEELAERARLGGVVRLSATTRSRSRPSSGRKRSTGSRARRKGCARTGVVVARAYAPAVTMRRRTSTCDRDPTRSGRRSPPGRRTGDVARWPMSRSWDEASGSTRRRAERSNRSVIRLASARIRAGQGTGGAIFRDRGELDEVEPLLRDVLRVAKQRARSGSMRRGDSAEKPRHARARPCRSEEAHALFCGGAEAESARGRRCAGARSTDVLARRSVSPQGQGEKLPAA